MPSFVMKRDPLLGSPYKGVVFGNHRKKLEEER